jgi:glutamine amidotransferase|tara:strand:+ start:5353 stop:5931 length:579 start_codon:yes stop_codon:yes gene_type:complete
MKIGILDCGGANLNSIYYSLMRLGVDSLISTDKNELDLMDGIIIPGVGSAGNVMKNLKDKNLISYIKNTKKQVLGICIGMQILYEYSEEDNTNCLGIIKGKIKKFKPSQALPVPQMGWNNVIDQNNKATDHYYFANSYYAPVSEYTVATSSYINDFTSILKKDNFLGCQFHPEKSSYTGAKFLEYFMSTICK